MVMARLFVRPGGPNARARAGIGAFCYKFETNVKTSSYIVDRARPGLGWIAANR
jgi:hypothetical protein